MRMIIILAVAYAGFSAVAYFMQGRLIFPRHFAGPPRLGASQVGGMEEVTLRGADGVEIVAWFFVGLGRDASSPGPAVIFAHGNGELVDDNVPLARMYAAMGVSALLIEYRGYGRAQGAPGQRAIVGDFVQFRDWLDQCPEVDPDRIVYHGKSLGGGVAAALAAERRPAAMVLESTFTSVVSMTARYLLPPLLCRHPFRTDRVLPGLNVPTLIMHGTRDLIIPIAHGRRLAAMTPGAAFVEFDSGHNDLPSDLDLYETEIHSLLERAGLLGHR